MRPSTTPHHVARTQALLLSGPEFFHSSLAAWNAPSTDVPHFWSSVGVRDGEIALELDFRPRLNAAYDAPRGADGEYLAPTSRAEFQQSSLRAAYAASFFTPEAHAWAESVRATEGAREVVAPSATSFIANRRQFGGDNAGLCSGPLLVSLRLPLTSAGVRAAAEACTAAMARWLGWMEVAEDASWMNQRMIYDRDCQVRQLLRMAEAHELDAQHGAEGASLAAAHAGRLDMAGHNMMQVGPHRPRARAAQTALRHYTP